ncbi:MAG: metallophosphoesterase family protein [Candidatus Merdivicinus sp.]
MRVKTVSSSKTLLIMFLLTSLCFLLPASAFGSSVDLQAPQVLAEGESFEVQYSGAVKSSWLGVYPAGASFEEAPLQQIPLDGEVSAEGTVEISALPVGEYQLALYRFGKNPALVRDFLVTGSPAFLDRRTYEQGGRAEVILQSSSYEEDAWIGVYAAGSIPGEDPWLLWGNLRDLSLPGRLSLEQLQGETAFPLLAAGEYQLILFSDSGYEAASSFPFSIIPSSQTRLSFMPGEDAVRNSAEGTLIITPSIEQPEYYWIYWADDEGILEDYTEIGTVPSDGLTPIPFQMPDHIAVPSGATRIVLRGGTETASRTGSLLAEVRIPPASIAAEESAYSFAVLSDIHISQNNYYIYNRNYTRMVRDVIKNMPDIQAMIYTGDVTNNGKPIEFSVLSKLLDQFQNQLPTQYLLLGNHDLALNQNNWGQQTYNFMEYTGMPGIYYSFELGGSSFLCLGSEDATGTDTVTASIGKYQLEWLAGKLEGAAAADPTAPIFVFIHQPLQNTLIGSEVSAIVQNDQLRELLDQYPQAVVFSGHTHSALNDKNVLFDGSGQGASMVHSGSVCALWDFTSSTSGGPDSGGGSAKSGSQGIKVEVSSQYIRIRSRDFQSGKWMGDAERILWFAE